MITYPIQFSSSSLATAGIQSTWQSHSPDGVTAITMAIPTAFGGPGTGYSPEDLYAMALQNCFVATFKVLAENSGFPFHTLHVETQLFVDRGADTKPWMARCHLKATLTGVSDPALGEKLLHKTCNSCLIWQSVRTEKTYAFVVNR